MSALQFLRGYRGKVNASPWRHQRTVSAAVRLSPSPPARVLSRNTNTSLRVGEPEAVFCRSLSLVEPFGRR